MFKIGDRVRVIYHPNEPRWIGTTGVVTLTSPHSMPRVKMDSKPPNGPKISWSIAANWPEHMLELDVLTADKVLAEYAID